TLAELRIQLMLSEQRQYRLQIFCMFLRCLTVDEDVVEVHDDEAIRHSRNTSCMSCMKVAGALHKPNGMTKNSKWPYLVLKAVLGMSSGWMRIWWYPLRRSSLLKYFAPRSWSNNSSML